MVLELKPMGKLDTPRAQVLDRTKVLHGSRTQAYRKTRHSKSLALDRIKVLHGPWTQAYGETRHSNGLSARQNQGLAWSSDLSLWGN